MTHRQRLATAAIAAAALLPVAPSQAQTLPPGPTVNITMVTQLSPSIPQYTKVDIPMLREGIPAKSGGRIKVTLASWPERSLNGPELLRVIRSGQIDIGGPALPTVAGDVPMLEMSDLAGLNPSHEQARKVIDAVLPEVNKELERFGVRIIATFPYPAQVFFCREPVRSLADLKGRRIRTAGGSTNDFVQAIGAQPTAIGFPEVYGALERGVVDCAVTGTATGNGARWYEVTSHMYALPVLWGTSAYVANLAWWNKLDPAVRDFLQATFKDVENQQWKLGQEATEDGIACNAGKKEGCTIGHVVDKKPMTITRPSEADMAFLRENLSSVVLPAWVKRCGARCGETYNRLAAPITGIKYEAR
ncbi:MAG: TRAP transporter substrate-binding protein [Lautropia sp.]